MSLKKLLPFLVFSFVFWTAEAQELYYKAYGNPTDQALVFLHGGPGYNSVTFEVSTAEDLAEEGFYVVVYDRRGEGRSADPEAAFTFEETVKDLKALCATLELDKVSLIGHSFGGVVAARFTQEYPEMVTSIVLVATPFDIQETYQTILESVRAIYTAKDDDRLSYIDILDEMDRTTLQFSSYCLSHAMLNKFYSPKNPTDDALQLYISLTGEPLIQEFSAAMTKAAPKGFWENEQYTTIDISDDISELLEEGKTIYAIYGEDDGLFSEEQIEAVSEQLGPDRVWIADRSSHSVFIDRHELFIDKLAEWLK